MIKAMPHPARPIAPTAAQKEAGNYAMERMTFQGLPITIENPRGSIRSGKDRGGHEWSVSMAHHYGYIRGTVGSDGDHYDVYVGPNAEASHAYIVTTMAPPAFTAEDEQKAMLGFNSEEEARAAYLAHYDNPRFFGGIQAMPMDEFKAKVLATTDGDGMVKAILFLKAQIKGGAAGDLFGETVTVEGHTRGGKFVAPYQATRKKKAEAPPEPPISNFGADKIAAEVFAHAAARRKAYGKNPPLQTYAGMLGAWAYDNKRKVSDADEAVILRAMEARAKGMATGLERQQDGLAPSQEPMPQAEAERIVDERLAARRATEEPKKVVLMPAGNAGAESAGGATISDTGRLAGDQGRSTNMGDDPRIAAYVSAGGKLWTGQNGQKRIYFNIDIPEILGWSVSHYGTGNVSGATLNGEPVSNTKATAAMERLGFSKVWIDTETWRFKTDRLTSDELQAVSDEIKRRAGRA